MSVASGSQGARVTFASACTVRRGTLAQCSFMATRDERQGVEDMNSTSLCSESSLHGKTLLAVQGAAHYPEEEI